MILSLKTFKPPKNHKEWEDLFFESCHAGDFERVQKLCSSNFQSIADLHGSDEWGFQLACENGHLEIVKFLTTAPELLEAGHSFVDIHANDKLGFLWACENGHLEVIQFLTTSTELLAAGHEFLNIHEDHEYGFRWACINGHLDVVKFLTAAPELLEAGHSFVDIYAKDEMGFQWAFEYHHWNIIQFLIFDLKIERTPTIDIMIKDNAQVQSYFNAREEQERFQQSLTESRSTIDPPTTTVQYNKPHASFRV